MKMMFGSLILAGLASLAPVMAQSSTVRVNVPFAFAAGDSQYPAGQYELRYQAAAHLVLLTSVDSTPAAHLLSPTVVDTPNAGTGSNLVFRKYGDEYCLRGVAFDNGTTVFGFGPTKAERTRLKGVKLEVATIRTAAR